MNGDSIRTDRCSGYHEVLERATPSRHDVWTRSVELGNERRRVGNPKMTREGVVPNLANSVIGRSYEDTPRQSFATGPSASASCPLLGMQSPPVLLPHSISWPVAPSAFRRDVRPPSSSFLPHRARNATSALILLDLLEAPCPTAPMNPEAGAPQPVIELAKKGRKFIEALMIHQDFAKARQVMRSHRRALLYNRVQIMEPEEEYLVLAEWYRGRMQII